MIFISILLLFLIAILILVLNRYQVRPGYVWIIALGGGLAAWLMILFSRSQAPLVIPLMQWKPEELFSASPALLLDEISWVYAAALAVFPLAVLLTDVIQYADVDPGSWAAGLAMTGLGLLAVFAENPLTLMLAWVVMDFSETIMLLQMVAPSADRERVVVALSMRLIGLFLVLTATLRALSLGTSLLFDRIPPDVSGLLLLAAGLRLGVLPPHQPFFHEPTLRRGLGTIVRLSPVASSLVLLARVGQLGVPLAWEPYLFAAAVLSALYGGFAWFQASNELDGRPFWILGMASIAFVAALYRLPGASIAWGVALLLSGGVLFLISYRTRFVTALAFLGLLGSSLLPFTPAWKGGLLYNSSGITLLIVFVLAHALILAAYIRHALRHSMSLANVERWMVVIYPIGLLVLIFAHWGIAWAGGLLQTPGFPVSSVGWWGGVITLGVVLALMGIGRRELSLPSLMASVLSRLLSLEWMYRIFWWLYRITGRVFSSISLILEGEGGVLWALVMLVLLVSLVIQQGGGG